MPPSKPSSDGVGGDGGGAGPLMSDEHEVSPVTSTAAASALSPSPNPSPGTQDAATAIMAVGQPTQPGGEKDAWDAFVDANWAGMLDAAYGSTASWKQEPTEVSAMVMALVQQRPGGAGTPILSLPRPLTTQAFGDAAAAGGAAGGQGGQQQPLQQAIQTAELMQEVLRSVLGAADRTLQALQENGAGLLQGATVTELSGAPGAPPVLQITAGIDTSGTVSGVAAGSSSTGAIVPRAWPLEVLTSGTATMPAGSSTYELFDVLQQELQQRLTIVASRISGGRPGEGLAAHSITPQLMVASAEAASKPVVAHAITTSSATSSSGGSEADAPAEAAAGPRAAAETGSSSTPVPGAGASDATAAPAQGQASPQLPHRHAKRRSSGQRLDADAAVAQAYAQSINAPVDVTSTGSAASQQPAPTELAFSSPAAGTVMDAAAGSSGRPERAACSGGSGKALAGKRTWDAATLAMMPVEMQQAWQKILDHLGSSDEHGRWGDLMEQMIAQFKPHADTAGGEGPHSAPPATTTRPKAGKQKAKTAKKGGATAAIATSTPVALQVGPVAVGAPQSGPRVAMAGSELPPQSDGSSAATGKRERGSDGPSTSSSTTTAEHASAPALVPQSTAPTPAQQPQQQPQVQAQHTQEDVQRVAGAVGALTTATNLQDLKLVAPGLQAAAQALARHPLLHALTLSSPIQLLDVSITPGAVTPAAGPAPSMQASGNSAGTSAGSGEGKGGSIRSFRQVLDGADETGRVPLHAAVIAGRGLVVDQLLFMGADINKRLPADPAEQPASSSTVLPAAPAPTGTPEAATLQVASAPASPAASAAVNNGAGTGAVAGGQGQEVEVEVDLQGSGEDRLGRDSLDISLPLPPSSMPSPERAPAVRTEAEAVTASASEARQAGANGGKATKGAAPVPTSLEPSAVKSPAKTLQEARAALARAREKHQRAELIHQMVRQAAEKQAAARAHDEDGSVPEGTLPPLLTRTLRTTPVRSLLGPHISLRQGTALHLAVFHGHSHILEVLLANALLDAGARTADGLTALHVAAAKGDTQMVTRLLRHPGVDPEAVDTEGHNALHHAAARGHVDAVEALWPRCANIESPTKAGHTPLHLAAEAGHVEVVGRLVIAGCHVHHVDGQGYTPGHLAALAGHVRVLEKLLLAGLQVDMLDGCGNTCLTLAAGEGHADVVAALLASSASPERPDTFGRTPLQRAAEWGRVAAATTLLQHGASPLAADSSGSQVLHSAAIGGSWELCELLLKQPGVTVDMPVVRTGETALHYAARAGSTEVVSGLLAAGADPLRCDDQGLSPWHLAAHLGQLEVLRLFLKHGVDVCACPPAGQPTCGLTALHVAARAGRYDTVSELLSAGASVLARDDKGRSCLHCATAARDMHLVAQLVGSALASSGAKGCLSLVDAQDEAGWTALHLAALQGEDGIMRVLLDAGANPRLLTVRGCSALHLAAKQRQLPAAEMLLAAGCPLDLEDSSGCTALHYAAFTGDVHMFQLLYKHYTPPPKPDHPPGERDVLECFGGLRRLAGAAQLLHYAAQGGCMEIIDTLLAAGLAEHDDKAGVTGAPNALHLACKLARGGVVERLLACGYNAHAPTVPRALRPIHYCSMSSPTAPFPYSAATQPLTPSAAVAADAAAAASDAVAAAAAAAEQAQHVCSSPGPDAARGAVASLSVERVPDGEGFGPGAAEDKLPPLPTPRMLHDIRLPSPPLTAPASSPEPGAQLRVLEALVAAGVDVTVPDARGRTALMYAGSGGNGQLVARLAELGADAAAADGERWCPLHFAAAQGHADAAAALLALPGAPGLMAADSRGRLPLHWSADGGHSQVAAALAEAMIQAGGDVHVADADGVGAAQLAASRGHVDVVAAILSKAQPQDITGKAQAATHCPLHAAAAAGMEQVVALLLSSGAASCTAGARDADGATALHVAAGAGHLGLVRQLLDAGSDVHAASTDGTTPLHKAAAGGHVQLIAELLEAGANPSAKRTDGSMPLHAAAAVGSKEACERLLAAGAPVGAKTATGVTPLYAAASCGSCDCVELILARDGVDLDAQTTSGCTAVHIAATSGHADVVEVLSEAGADLDIPQSNSATPLCSAVSMGHYEVVDRLLVGGCDMDVQNNTGNTALHLAAAKGSMEMVQRLLAQDADVNVRNAKGMNAAASAAAAGYFDVVTRLVQGGSAWRAKGDVDVVKLLCKKANLKASYVEGRLRLAERERSRQISAATTAGRKVAASSKAPAVASTLGVRTSSQTLPDHLLQQLSAEADANMAALLQEEAKAKESQKAKKEAKAKKKAVAKPAQTPTAAPSSPPGGKAEEGAGDTQGTGGSEPRQSPASVSSQAASKGTDGGTSLEEAHGDAFYTALAAAIDATNASLASASRKPAKGGKADPSKVEAVSAAAAKVQANIPKAAAAAPVAAPAATPATPTSKKAGKAVANGAAALPVGDAAPVVAAPAPAQQKQLGQKKDVSAKAAAGKSAQAPAAYAPQAAVGSVQVQQPPAATRGTRHTLPDDHSIPLVAAAPHQPNAPGPSPTPSAAAAAATPVGGPSGPWGARNTTPPHAPAVAQVKVDSEWPALHLSVSPVRAGRTPPTQASAPRNAAPPAHAHGQQQQQQHGSRAAPQPGSASASARSAKLPASPMLAPAHSQPASPHPSLYAGSSATAASPAMQPRSLLQPPGLPPMSPPAAAGAGTSSRWTSSAADLWGGFGPSRDGTSGQSLLSGLGTGMLGGALSAVPGAAGSTATAGAGTWRPLTGPGNGLLGLGSLLNNSEAGSNTGTSHVASSPSASAMLLGGLGAEMLTDHSSSLFSTPQPSLLQGRGLGAGVSGFGSHAASWSSSPAPGPIAGVGGPPLESGSPLLHHSGLSDAELPHAHTPPPAGLLLVGQSLEEMLEEDAGGVSGSGHGTASLLSGVAGGGQGGGGQRHTGSGQRAGAGPAGLAGMQALASTMLLAHAPGTGSSIWSTGPSAPHQGSLHGLGGSGVGLDSLMASSPPMLGAVGGGSYGTSMLGGGGLFGSLGSMGFSGPSSLEMGGLWGQPRPTVGGAGLGMGNVLGAGLGGASSLVGAGPGDQASSLASLFAASPAAAARHGLSPSPQHNTWGTGSGNGAASGAGDGGRPPLPDLPATLFGPTTPPAAESPSAPAPSASGYSNYMPHNGGQGGLLPWQRQQMGGYGPRYGSGQGGYMQGR